MKLIQGKMLGTSDKVRYSMLKQNIQNTLKKPPLSPMIVIHACDCMADNVLNGRYEELLKKIPTLTTHQRIQIQRAARLIKHDSLCYRMETELGGLWKSQMPEVPVIPDFLNNHEVIEHKRYYPLGVLMHIAAGNMEILPFFSVIEGLLTGNINLLKLPGNDQGITIQLMIELIRIEPALAEYIYVFDTPSYHMRTMKQLSELADAVIVWGSDAAVQSVRMLARPNQRIIEWGHKISFAYLSGLSMKQEEHVLWELAHHMYLTKQLLCSSCQGIYLDTDNMDEIERFCERFLLIMDEVGKEYDENSLELQAMLTLKLYNEELEQMDNPVRIYRGKKSNISAYQDSRLTASLQFGNCWVRPLLKENIISELYPMRGYLQTAALCCKKKERSLLTEYLARAGLNRITGESDMSRMLAGETHDGKYSLQQYVRVVEVL